MHISYIIWCRNPKFGVMIPLGMAEWCIPFWVTLTLTLTSGLISRFFLFGAYLLYYSLLSSNVSYARPIPLGAFVTCLWHFLFSPQLILQKSNGLFLKKIVIFQGSRGGLSFFPRGGRGVAWLQLMCRPNGRGVWGLAPPEKFSVLDCPNMYFAIILHL